MEEIPSSLMFKLMHLKSLHLYSYNLIHNFSIIARGAWRARLCATSYFLTDARHTLRVGIVRDDRELFHQIIVLTLTGTLLEVQYRVTPKGTFFTVLTQFFNILEC